MTQQNEQFSECSLMPRETQSRCRPARVAIMIGLGSMVGAILIGFFVYVKGLSMAGSSPFIWLALGCIVVSGVILPVALAALYYTFYRYEQRRKATEKEHSRLEKYLRHAQKMEAIGALAGGIAHDFNNILYAIQGYVDLAMQDVDRDTEVYGFLEEIAIGNKRATELVKQILALGMQSEQKRQPLRLSIMVREVAKFLKSALPPGIELVLEVNDKDDFVMADPGQIHQILLNLCTNACQSMCSGPGRLGIRQDTLLLEKSDYGLPPGLYTQLTVSDSGKGVPPEDAERIFDPYFTTKDPGDGTGLGLATVHSLVKNLGGSIVFESAQGQGSIFTVLLPACEPAEAVEETSTDRMINLAGNEHILLVDDEAPIVYSMQLALRRLGYRISSTTSPVEALSIFRSEGQDIDVIITDYSMPHMSGLDLAKDIHAVRSDIPILLCTGFSEIVKNDEARGAGIRECIMKPIKSRDLAMAVRHVLKEVPCIA
ncbi:MAG: response regulator [Spartobacteria bacterium]|nr:response regulator [Spartobacteria bacterium]